MNTNTKETASSATVHPPTQSVPGISESNFHVDAWNSIPAELREWLFPTAHAKWVFSNGPGGGEEKRQFLGAAMDVYEKLGLAGVVTFMENRAKWFELDCSDPVTFVRIIKEW